MRIRGSQAELGSVGEICDMRWDRERMMSGITVHNLFKDGTVDNLRGPYTDVFM